MMDECQTKDDDENGNIEDLEIPNKPTNEGVSNRLMYDYLHYTTIRKDMHNQHLKCTKEFMERLNSMVKVLVGRAKERAKANGRTFVMGRDA